MTEDISLKDYRKKIEDEIKKLDDEKKKLDVEIEKIEERENYLKRLEVDVPEANVFKLEDGRILRNLQDLIDAIENMDNNTFKNHVNVDKNDFANWVRDLIDMDLGDKMSYFKRKKSLQHFLSKLDRTDIDELIKKLKEEEENLEDIEEDIVKDEIQLKKDEENLE